MRNKITIFTVAAITTIAAAVFISTAVHAVFYAPEPEVAPSPALHISSVPKIPSQYPVRIRIPSLGVDAKVDAVGIGKSGNMAVPPNFTDVGWYKYGPLPGALGSAVIDGHVDNGLALAGVFKYLTNIRPGDDIFVTSQAGDETHFIVENVEAYPFKSVPVDLVFNRADTARLNLISCEGVWVQGSKTYDHRFVVFAKIAQ